jgi:transcriptional regulator with XRE-family HTH domain
LTQATEKKGLGLDKKVFLGMIFSSMEMFDDVPDFLRWYRRQVNLTQEQLAERTMVLKSNISRIETDSQVPGLTNFGKLLTGLGLDLEEFVREYRRFQRQRREWAGEEGSPEAPRDFETEDLKRALKPYLEVIPSVVRQGLFETETHVVILVPKP